MASFNKVILCGNLTRDPDLKYTPKGTAIARLGLAMNRKWKTESGESKEEVTFVDCTIWGKTAETAAQYLKKGSPVMFEGRLHQESWEDKTSGAKRTKLKVIVETMVFLGSGGGGKGGGQRQGGGGGGGREEYDEYDQRTDNRRGGGGGYNRR